MIDTEGGGGVVSFGAHADQECCLRALQRWAPVNSQGVQQTVPIAKVDVQTVAAGYRASKVIGSSVLNEARETIGKIDDLLVTRDGKEPYAVLSTGGFLTMGTHMVVVRYDSLENWSLDARPRT
jgi:hypothetical protein